MKLKDFDYELPKDLIAQEPLASRDQSRLLVVQGNKIEHKFFFNCIDYLEKDDVLVVNTSKVIPARLCGTKATGGKVSVLLIKQLEGNTWECLAQGNKLHNKTVNFNGVYGIVKHEKRRQKIIFTQDIKNMLHEIGEAPLPPYITKRSSLDRYNTVYAQEQGSVAAPTAGLHFTPELLGKIRNKGVRVVSIILHVGLGTFLPVKSEDVEYHEMHEEFFHISEDAANVINNRKGRLFCVGTTTIRALESAANSKGIVKPCSSSTSLFITPGYKWKLPYAGLFSNFHLPKSTLLMLVMAFLTPEQIRAAYQTAIREKYRFYSFGDATLLIKKEKFTGE